MKSPEESAPDLRSPEEKSAAHLRSAATHLRALTPHRKKGAAWLAKEAARMEAMAEKMDTPKPEPISVVEPIKLEITS